MWAAQAHRAVVAHIPYAGTKNAPDKDTRAGLQYLWNFPVNLVKADVLPSSTECGIPKQHLLSRNLTLQTALPTFLEWCYAVSGTQLFHSTCFLTTTGTCRLYVSVESQNKTSTSRICFLVWQFRWLVVFCSFFFKQTNAKLRNGTASPFLSSCSNSTAIFITGVVISLDKKVESYEFNCTLRDCLTSSFVQWKQSLHPC